MTTTLHERVRDYYGRVLQKTRDLKTTACCTTGSLPRHIRAIVDLIEPEIKERFYGCGSPVPPAVDGCTVLDLGCGTGRDAYICSKLVGPAGLVYGLDMTDEQLEIARRNLDAQMQKFGYRKPNVTFVQGYMEDLVGAGIPERSVDVVISNCVINLAPDKRRVFEQILKVLKPGGEILFADVFADRRLPDRLREDQVLLGECLAGAMYIEDFRRLMFELGIRDTRELATSPIDISDPEIADKIGNARFRSITVRAFNLPDSVEDRCEDYGQVATYRGTMANRPHAFALDDHHVFETGRPMLVCGNTAAMVQETRFGRHFDVQGDRSVHHGLFPCGPTPTTAASDDCATGACC